MSSRRRGRRPALRCNLEVLTGALVRHYASVQPRRERATLGLSRRVPGGWVELPWVVHMSTTPLRTPHLGHWFLFVAAWLAIAVSLAATAGSLLWR